MAKQTAKGPQKNLASKLTLATSVAGALVLGTLLYAFSSSAGMPVTASASPNSTDMSVQSTGSAASQSDMNAQASSTSSTAVLNQKPVPMTVTRNGQNVHVVMTTEETTVKVADGVAFHAWTFDGTVPGPVLYLKQGDNVTLTLHNLDPYMSHSIDLHAAMVAPNVAFTDVAPKSTKTIRFVASVPGVFMYHCATMPMVEHMAMGMYGAVVVTPKGQPQPDFTLVQSEIYNGGDYNKVLNDQPDEVAFNGFANRYVEKPLQVKVGKPIRIAVVDAGPDEFSAFHIVGTVMQDVEASGNPRNNLYDVSTYTIAPGDGMLATVTFNQPGTYAFVSHSMMAYGRGDVGKIVVTK